ncbi:RNA polymerase [Enterococcus gallinarum EG2]|nr:RNA polymerase [Enterococcus gallinarum EG2]
MRRPYNRQRGEKMNDHQMIHLIKNKDYTGLEQLIDSYGSSILMTIHRILQAPPEQSEWSDVANEVFYEIWQKIEAYDPEKSSFITWILLITRSRGIDRKRKLNKAFQQESIEEYQELAITESPLSEEEFLIWLEELSQVDQQIFLLYYFYQESPEEIAQQLDLQTTAIYNHLSRGRKLLKKIWKERMNRDEF